MKRCIIYALCDPDTGEVRYIGQTANGMLRPRAHLTPSAGKGRAHYHANWIRSLRRAGKRPTIRVLEEVPNAAALDAAERRWIARGRGLGWRLTNSTDGGDGIRGHHHSAETKEKISRANRGRPGRRGPQSPEHIAARVAALKGRQRSAAHKEAISRANRGRPMHPNTRAALLASRLGSKHSAETKAKMRAAALGRPGRPLSEREVAKLTTAAQTAESRAKRATSMRKAWSDPAFRERQRRILRESWARRLGRSKMRINLLREVAA